MNKKRNNIKTVLSHHVTPNFRTSMGNIASELFTECLQQNRRCIATDPKSELNK